MRMRLGGLRGIYFGYWLIGAAFIANFVSIGVQNYIVGAFFIPMTDELGWTRTEFTVARTIGQVFFALAGLFIGAYVDREGGRRLMRVGTLVLASALFAHSLVQDLWQWILLNGIALAAGSAMIGQLIVNVTLAKWFVEKRGRAIGVAAMGVSFGGVLLTPITTGLVDAIGWRDAWRVLAVGTVAVVLPITLLMRRAPEDHGLHPDGRSGAEVAAGEGAAAAIEFASSLTRAQALRLPSFYLVGVGFGLGSLSIGMMLVHTIPFVTDAGYSRATGALMIAISSVPAMIVKPLWGYFTERADVQRLSKGCFLLTGLGLVLIVAGARLENLSLLATGYFVHGVGYGGLIPLQEVVWATFFGRRYLGAVRSAGLPFALLLNASSPLLGSVYFDRVGDYEGAFLSAAVLAVFAAVLVSLARRPRRIDGSRALAMPITAHEA
jgi:OFA family oxalate/formate antiporter-like MFS transporter